MAASARCCWLQVTDSNGGVILFIDEIHTVVGAGASEGSMDAGAPPCWTLAGRPEGGEGRRGAACHQAT